MWGAFSGPRRNEKVHERKRAKAVLVAKSRRGRLAAQDQKVTVLVLAPHGKAGRLLHLTPSPKEPSPDPEGRGRSAGLKQLGPLPAALPTSLHGAAFL